MASFNKVILVGNITADPELKQTTSGMSVCNFSLAYNRRPGRNGAQDQQTVDFFNIVSFGQTAEFVSRYFKKGSPILVCGRLQTRKWTDQQGQTRNTVEVVAEEATFVTAANQNGQAPATASAPYTPEAYSTPSFNGAGSASFEEIPDDGNLPF